MVALRWALAALGVAASIGCGGGGDGGSVLDVGGVEDAGALPDGAADTWLPSDLRDGADDQAAHPPGPDGLTDAAADTPDVPLPPDAGPGPDLRDSVEGPDVRADVLVAAGPVVLNEVVPAAPDGGPDWLEIYNRSAERVSVAGWSLRDSDDAHVWTVPAGVSIPAGGFLVLRQSAAPGEPGFDFGLGGADSARLFDADGALVDATTWAEGAAPAGRSWGRWPDGGEWYVLRTPTPGAPNAEPWVPLPDVVDGPDAGGEDVPEVPDVVTTPDVGTAPDVVPIPDVVTAPDAAAIPDSGANPDGASAPDVVAAPDLFVIPDLVTVPDVPPPADVPPDVPLPPVPPIVVNEIMARDPLGGADWAELYNPSPIDWDVGGYLVTDHPNDPLSLWETLPPDRIVPAGGFLILWARDAPQGADFTFAFKSDDDFRLAHPDGTLVDGTSWTDGQAPEGGSWGRYPDGTGGFVTLPASTPGGPNAAPAAR